MSQLAKLSHKGQITVPAEVNMLENGKISVHQVEEPLDASYLTALNDVLSEWNSTEDDEAYRNL